MSSQVKSVQGLIERTTQHHPLRISYILKRKIAENPQIRTFVPKDLKADARVFEGVGSTGEQLVRDLFKIHGVSTVYLSATRLGVLREERYEWAELEPKIILVLVQAVLKAA